MFSLFLSMVAVLGIPGTALRYSFKVTNTQFGYFQAPRTDTQPCDGPLSVNNETSEREPRAFFFLVFQGKKSLFIKDRTHDS